MASLPIDIITEILARLPVKTLTRFLSVDKSWYSLIKNPDFIKKHLNQTLISNSENYLILGQSSIYIAEFNLDSIHNALSFSELNHPLKPYEVEVICSCNGVLCIGDFHKNNIFLYNPLTNSRRKLQVNHIKDPKLNWNDRVVYGFGYDSVTDDYKVFCYFQKSKQWEVLYSEVEVFSFKSNFWKSVERISDLDFFANHIGVYLNEAMYYVVYKEEFDLRHKFIAKFDFRTDTMLRVECPNLESNDKFRDELVFSLSALDGCLCMLVSYFPDDSFPEVNMGDKDCPLERAELWMMKECGKKEVWVRLFSIRDPRSIGIENVISTVVFSKDKRKILLEVDGSKLGWYDLDGGCFERITTCGQPEFWVHSAVCFLSGSLVSLADDKLQLRGATMPKEKEERYSCASLADDKLQLEGRTMPKKKEKRNSDKFLSTGFKLKL